MQILISIFILRSDMPALVNYRGDDEIYSGGSICSGDPGLVFSMGSHMEMYCPPRKRSRVMGPLVNFIEERRPSIDVLPDECLYEVFRHLAGRERSTSACVSKRWLMLLASVRSSELCGTKNLSEQSDNMNLDTESTSEDLEIECDGYLTRCVEGNKATDVRLAAIAVGTSSRGGLGKLSVRGSNPTRVVSDIGLSAIARGCPSLHVLSLWNVPSIGDGGLLEIARECHSLSKLDLSQCPSISNKGLVAIAQSSPDLTSLTIESCSHIGDESLQAIGKYCPKLKCITIKDCPLVGDQGITSLFSGCKLLAKVKLQGLNITDLGVAVIGHYGKEITNLVLGGLQNVSQRGFWVMGNTQGLKKVSSLNITSCRGITDLSLPVMVKGCPNLKHLTLRKCYFVSDNGFVAFAKGANSLESLQLEECHRITQFGLLNALSSSSSKLKSLTLVKCMGIKDLSVDFPVLSQCKSLRSLSIRSCPGVGTTSLSMVGNLCPNLHQLDLSGLTEITDVGLLQLLESCNPGLAKVNLSECSNLTDNVVFCLTNLHGETLELVNLDGCHKITDASLVSLAQNCPSLNDLGISKCSITDSGVFALAYGVHSNLQILSLSGCSMLSNKSVPALETLGRTLVGLNLQHCNSITSSAIESLTENLWRCDILS